MVKSYEAFGNGSGVPYGEYTFLNINVMEIKVWPFLFNDAKLSFGRFPTGFVESFILEQT